MTTFSPLTHPGRKAPEPMLRSLSMRLRSANICHVCLVAVLLLLAPGVSHAKDQASSQLAFGVDMAKRGLWKEALFRFQQAEKLEPENPHIQSNLGVAAEAAGQFDKALEYYQKALRLAPNDKGIRTNYTRFVEFYQGFKGKKDAKKGSLTMPAPSAPAPKAPPAGKPPIVPEPVIPGPKPSAPEDTPPPAADVRPPL
jgi:tetratricopeptide (TPR) repeat protein